MDLWPGASRIVKCFFSVSKYARPTSTVLPLFLSSALVSMHHDRYQVSLLISFASFSYFSRVLLSTMFVRYMIWPPMVDFPASTCPMNTTFTCSLSVVLEACTTGFFFTREDFLIPVSSSIEFSSSSGVVAALLMSALSSQLSPTSSADASVCMGVGASSLAFCGSGALGGAAGLGTGSAGSQEGTKAVALTLGTKAGAATLSCAILADTSSCSQESGAPLVAIPSLPLRVPKHLPLST